MVAISAPSPEIPANIATAIFKETLAELITVDAIAVAGQDELMYAQLFRHVPLVGPVEYPYKHVPVAPHQPHPVAPVQPEHVLWAAHPQL